ncbi:ADP-ribose pyrophosphatase [Curtobacterium citreum]|uniref:NUDIX hydrolase n=1 Tax=Curtobacterium citreum TaxID=2036 RepID=A0ABT2HHX3_9MICO|nr:MULTISPECIES: NUDIX domain-containing protein [Curtobacterium]MCS6522864.1 NUDIX hydrolase [Curtobacterium citreum]RDI00298.1 ADP-ribose pyrophosphatase YjhB (NUDIX family) [Curtobacterium sp. AG1037]TQJ28772.1 ADP-ribose pyrophosphatase YjhB (NUDIX family) [Curtobacterium citreum]GGL67757.1 ADP-ribose pyrophosphatase [Curtobacterium citreum]
MTLSPEPAPTAIRVAVSTVIVALRPHPDTGAPALWMPLVRRVAEPHEGSWALPGGWVGPDEGLEDSAAARLRETTNVQPRYLEQLYAFGDVDRSPSRVVSIVYWALVHPDEASSVPDDWNVRWFLADEHPPLAFDHDRIVEYALWRLRTKVSYSRIAQAFLGDRFTLTELRGVYEAVLGRALDPANFRRQVAQGDAVLPTDETTSGGRHRPARLYRSNPDLAYADNGPLTPTTAATTVTAATH